MIFNFWGKPYRMHTPANDLNRETVSLIIFFFYPLSLYRLQQSANVTEPTWPRSSVSGWRKIRRSEWNESGGDDGKSRSCVNDSPIQTCGKRIERDSVVNSLANYTIPDNAAMVILPGYPTEHSHPVYWLRATKISLVSMARLPDVLIRIASSFIACQILQGFSV